eukprot:GGOE01037431.1.p1 GENE.GGOE01037431.1~~GGOE01037431.1.p1  ORF type:complete len:1361 (+),score=399.92 GGOE01037431.1:131-4213(+)
MQAILRHMSPAAAPNWVFTLEDLPSTLRGSDGAEVLHLQSVEGEMEREVVLLGDVNPRMAKTRERILEEAAKHDAEMRRQYEMLLAEEFRLREEDARNQLLQLRQRRTTRLKGIRHTLREKENQVHDRVRRLFLHSEDRLFHSLQGDQALLDKEQELDLGNQWRAEWAFAPQPIVVKLKAIRGVKDKLPEGYYVLLVMICDRLGGSALAYDPKADVPCRAASLPLLYSGKWFHVELSVNTKVRVVVPPRLEVASHLTLQFELWRLKKGRQDPLDKVVAWGAHPIVSKDLTVVTGSFKTVMLKGAPDVWIDRYAKMQLVCEESPQYWLGNLYFEVHLDRPHHAAAGSNVGTAPEYGGAEGFPEAGEEEQVQSSGRSSALGSDRGPRPTGRDGKPKEGREALPLPERDPSSDVEMGYTPPDEAAAGRPGPSSMAGDAQEAELAQLREELRVDATQWAQEDREREAAAEEWHRQREGEREQALQVELQRRQLQEGLVTDTEETERQATWVAQQQSEEQRRQEEEEAREAEKGRRMQARWEVERGIGRRIAELEAALEERRSGQLVRVASLSQRSNTHRPLSQGSTTAAPQADILTIHPPSRGGSAMEDLDASRTTRENAIRQLLGSRLTMPFRPKQTFCGVAVGTQRRMDAPPASRRSTAMKYLERRATAGPVSMADSKGLEDAWSAFQQWDAQRQQQGQGDIDVATDLLGRPEPLPLMDSAEEREQDEMRRIATASLSHQVSVCSRRHFLRAQRRFRDRLRIMSTVMLYDWGILGHWKFHPGRLLVTVLQFAAAMWVRPFTHALGTWTWLKTQSYTPTLESWGPLWAEIQWAGTSYWPVTEVIAVVSGCFTNGLFFTCFVLISWLCRLAFGGFWFTPSRFIFWYGLIILLDPLIVLVADCCRANFQHGELFMLFHYFKRYEGNAYIGILLTVASIVLVQLSIGVLFYHWFFRLHLNGRIQDTTDRLLLPETSFFLPHDLELSKAELFDIVERAKKWRSEAGDVRKVFTTSLTDRRVDLFRQRLWCLLTVGPPPLGNGHSPPQDLMWVRKYVQSITLRTRRNAGENRWGMATFTLGLDVLASLQSRYPYLVHRGSDNAFHDPSQGAAYWDTHMFQEERLTVVAVEERKEFVTLLGLWLESRCGMAPDTTSSADCPVAQLPWPCFWAADEAEETDALPDTDAAVARLTPGSTAFRVTDWQLVADFLLFETTGPKQRLKSLKELLILEGVDVSFWEAATSPTEPRKDSYLVRLPRFSMEDKGASIAGEEASAALVTINVVHCRTGRMEPYRNFLVCPNGSIVEPLPEGLPSLDSSDSDDDDAGRWARHQRRLVKPRFTADDCEYWVQRLAAIAPRGRGGSIESAH